MRKSVAVVVGILALSFVVLACNSLPTTQIIYGQTTCTTASTSYASCNSTLTFPASFVDTSYAVTCSGVPNNPGGKLNLSSQTTNTVVVSVTNGTANGAMADQFTNVNCIGVHP